MQYPRCPLPTPSRHPNHSDVREPYESWHQPRRRLRTHRVGGSPQQGCSSCCDIAPEAVCGAKPRRRAKGKGSRADQFCIYRTSDGQNIPVIAIEYRAHYKLSVDEIVTGLEAEIRQERDMINQDRKGHSFTSRRLAAAVVTQLFSYMIGKGIQYGYICTGQVFVFLYISDDPSVAYYSVCMSNLDVMDDNDTRLHRTAFAQVFAFILRALRSTPPPAE